MTNAQKIVNNLINENIFSFKVSSLKRCVIFGDNYYLSKHTFLTQNFSVYLFQ